MYVSSITYLLYFGSNSNSYDQKISYTPRDKFKSHTKTKNINIFFSRRHVLRCENILNKTEKLLVIGANDN